MNSNPTALLLAAPWLDAAIDYSASERSNNVLLMFNANFGSGVQ